MKLSLICEKKRSKPHKKSKKAGYNSKLAKVVKGSKLSQKEIARRAGISEEQLSNMIHNRKSGHIDTYTAIAGVLNISLNQIKPTVGTQPKSAETSKPKSKAKTKAASR